MTDEEKAGSPLRNRRDEAIGWWLRGKDRPLSPEDQTAFETWLARDPANKAAFDDISDMCEHFMGLRPRAASLSSPAMRRFWLGGAAAFAATSLAFFIYSGDISVYLRSDFDTGTGETKRLTLADGSHVELNAKSAIAVHYSDGQRRLTLLAGEACFDVSPDPARPFVVEAAGGTTTALGTAFDVALATNAAHVTVTEHRVAVASGGENVIVAGGQQTAYSDALRSGAAVPRQSGPRHRVAAGQADFRKHAARRGYSGVRPLSPWPGLFCQFRSPRAARDRLCSALTIRSQAIGEIETSLGLHATYLTRYLIFLHH